MLILAAIVGFVMLANAFAGVTRRLTFLREVAILLGRYSFDFVVGGITQGGEDAAVQNAHRIVEFQRALSLYVEPHLQEIALRWHEMDTVANWVYIWGHWPVIGVVAVWLPKSHPSTFMETRNALLLSGAIGLFFFALFPVAPPRLADLGFVDTVVGWSDSYRALQPTELVNQHAAFSSLHFGWNLLIAIAIWRVAADIRIRLVAAAMPVLMFFAIVLTANHFIVDAVGGAAVALTGLYLARRVTDSFDRSFDRGEGMLEAVADPTRTRVA